MKVLLFGEFNRAQWNIKQGLEALGHEAILVSTRDGFKKVDVDVEIVNPYTSFYRKKFRNLINRLFHIDLTAVSIKRQIKSKKHLLSDYDLVQFINEAPFDFKRSDQLDIFNWLKAWNKNVFLLSAGLDYPSVRYAYDKKFRYSILTPYFENKGSKKDFSPALSYLTEGHISLHHEIFKSIKGVISNDLDYHIPLIGHTKYLGMIPHAINLSLLQYQPPKIEDKIVIFHGINTFNYYKKGNDIFDAALKIITEKYPDKVEVIVAKNLPYKDYIRSFDKAHILLDQVYAYDQGFNALEAMAKGKVVFTGAEQEWLDYFNIEEDTVAINALPDAEDIAQKLEWLIQHPEKITEISKQSRAFVARHHDHISCAKAYLKTWQEQIK
ncbi:glycosyltransferase [Winogradskyella arenosi]|uniref:Glycosyltransferase involved in cell wall biosynthesis n=1 Tax=Winogradskyella arenosi TaxID=533325 RepID=A0A368ZEY3_9FLAO|nr:glycosyltransferase [Winogradskyella arenosi]RCW92086.1 glycosyltransferase involved in cell wall biosynthesis [Winogradskyella arenosi]